MNKILLIFSALVLSASMAAHGQNGKVYFIRSEGFQAPAAAFNLFADKKLIGRLGNKKYSIHDIKAGRHTFSTQFAGKKSKEKVEKIDVQVDDGKTYYYQVKFQHGIFKNKLHFKQLEEGDAKKMLPSLQQVRN